MAKLAEFLYKYDLRDEKFYCFLDKENPIKFKANNKILLSILKKVP